MKRLTIYFSILVLSVGFLSTSCTKVKDVNLDGKGQTLIQAPDAASGTIAVALDLVPGAKKVSVFNVRRDAPSNSELQKAFSVKVLLDTSVIGEYNRANGTSFEPLPDSTFTVDASNPFDGTYYTLNFAAGDFAKDVYINLDPTKLDLNYQFALGFRLSTSTYGNVSTSLNSLMTQVGAKNRYDGIYEVTGTMVDHVNPALTGNYPVKFKLITSGPYQCVGEDQDAGGIYHSILNAGAFSVYGSLGLVFNFASDGSGTIESIVNYYGQPAGNTRSLALDPSGVNKWDPTSHNISVKYFMIQTNQSTGTGPRTEFAETWKYKGPR
jgi:hypothetical protein